MLKNKPHGDIGRFRLESLESYTMYNIKLKFDKPITVTH